METSQETETEKWICPKTEESSVVVEQKGRRLDCDKSEAKNSAAFEGSLGVLSCRSGGKEL